ncbi:MAG: hypothetical protein JW953_03720 [Anaerolineae bacterium]|nr:hypothetical protein [Anaerolineae bacterium]
MALDLRIWFLFFLAITAFLFILRRGPFLSLNDLLQIVVDFFLVLAMAGTALTFGFLLTRQDPLPLLRNTAYQLSLQQLVSFEHIVPEHLEKSLATNNILRLDTDGDNYKEWIVFYQFDLQNSSNPVQAMVYDNDRGNPPVIFPYALRPPHRDYLGEGEVSLELENATIDQNGPDQEDLQEILVRGSNELGIFRFRQNSEQWDFPRDAPPRYQPIGFFRGSGGVSFDKNTKNVTVLDRAGFERSQLVNRLVYAVNKATNTYWDQFYDPAELDRKLAAPLISTIDFLGDPPQNIHDSTFPEKIVLAFYASTCGSKADGLCRNYNTGWNPDDFLDPNGDAFAELKNGNPGDFGLPSFNHTSDILVKYLQYFPQLETDPDLRETGGGRDVVTGEEAGRNVVDITFAVKDRNGVSQEETRRYHMTSVNGQWKIHRRLELDEMPELGQPTQILNR